MNRRGFFGFLAATPVAVAAGANETYSGALISNATVKDTYLVGERGPETIMLRFDVEDLRCALTDIQIRMEEEQSRFEERVVTTIQAAKVRRVI